MSQNWATPSRSSEYHYMWSGYVIVVTHVRIPWTLAGLQPEDDVHLTYIKDYVRDSVP